MKRRVFRLGSVLRFYEIQKNRSEYELNLATHVLQEIDAEITQLSQDITDVAELISGKMKDLSAEVWIACYRKTEHLGKRISQARWRRSEQVKVVAKLEETRKRWAIAEETLLSLKHDAAAFNRAEAERAQQMQADETVLRQWIGRDQEAESSSEGVVPCPE